MTRRKSVCLKWTLVLVTVLVCPSVYSRPQEVPAVVTNSGLDESTTETPIRYESTKSESTSPEQTASAAPESSARNVKSKTPMRESIEMVAIQLLDKPNSTLETPIISDTRMPPKLKTQVKHKVKTRNEDGEQFENVHRGEAVPVTMDELDTDNKINESSTSSDGISTWSSLSNSAKGNSPTESTKIDEKEKKPKPVKNKPKRPQTNKISKRPIIGSINKSDLVAGGSAINENVYNKIKDTVLSNVQKNKNASARPSTTTTTSTEANIVKKETKPIITPIVTVNNKTKKKNKNKLKTTSTTLSPPAIDDSALLPTEAKEQEIELEVSTPATTTKKPKRKSNKKKNKTKKRKTSTPKPNTGVAISDLKTTNKTKTKKNAKKPIPQTNAITTQIYNYLSREVMPSVGVGVLGIASLVGIAGYFLYPFAAPVRRTFEVDKSDDIYRNNAEEYAVDGNGQAEEEMLGTVLAGMPVHAKQKLNPYAGQTPNNNRYSVKKEQDIRYRYVTPSYNPNYKVHYAQQKTGIAHGAVYSKPFTYGPYGTRPAFKVEGKVNNEKPKQPNYTPYSAAAVEPIYAAPQTGPSGGGELSSYESDTSNSGVVYGVEPSPETDFKPVYPFENQFLSETTISSVTYSPTSMYLGLNNNGDNREEDTKYEESSNNSEGLENQFVVGNVPKEFSDSATPAVVPEHGPRKLRRKRSVSDSLEELLSDHDLDGNFFISNEIDDFFSSSSNPIRNLGSVSPNENVSAPHDIPAGSEQTKTSTDILTTEALTSVKNNFIRSISETSNGTKLVEADNTPISIKTDDVYNDVIVESVSTVPIGDESRSTEPLYDDFEITTESATIYEELFSTTPNLNLGNDLTDLNTGKKKIKKRKPSDATRTKLNLNQPTKPFKMYLTESTEHSTAKPTDQSTVKFKAETTTNTLDLSTYPPSTGIYSWIQKLLVMKLKFGLGLLEGTVDILNKLKTDTTKVLNNV